MATAADLITAAFQKVNIYDPTTAQTASALISLNNMIASWGAEFMFPDGHAPEFVLTSSMMVLSAEYREALVYNLAVSVAEDWDRIVPKTVYMRAKETKEIIDVLNASVRRPGLLTVDALLIPPQYYDITTGTW